MRAFASGVCLAERRTFEEALTRPHALHALMNALFDVFLKLDVERAGDRWIAHLCVAEATTACRQFIKDTRKPLDDDSRQAFTGSLARLSRYLHSMQRHEGDPH